MYSHESYLKNRDKVLLRGKKFNNAKRVHSEFINSLSVDELLEYVQSDI